MRCVGTDLKFHWVRHDEDDAPAAEAAPVGGTGAGAAGAEAGGGGDAKTGGGPVRRGNSITDKIMQKRKVF